MRLKKIDNIIFLIRGKKIIPPKKINNFSEFKLLFEKTQKRKDKKPSELFLKKLFINTNSFCFYIIDNYELNKKNLFKFLKKPNKLV